jgi:hypothetical protein
MPNLLKSLKGRECVYLWCDLVDVKLEKVVSFYFAHITYQR